jgi:hypothetical protein
MVSSRCLEPEPAIWYSVCFTVTTLFLIACNRSDRKQQVAECVAIYRTSYVTGQVSDCLVKRFGWSPEDAAEAGKEMARTPPDSAALGDSGQVGDSLRK